MNDTYSPFFEKKTERLQWLRQPESSYDCNSRYTERQLHFAMYLLNDENAVKALRAFNRLESVQYRHKRKEPLPIFRRLQRKKKKADDATQLID